MTIAQDIVSLALGQIINDDAATANNPSDLALGLTLLIDLIDHMQLDPQDTVGIRNPV